MGPGVVCEVWSTEPAPFIKFTGKGAAPLLVVGGTGDNATPYEYAQWMAEELESGILVTRDGVGHGSYDSGSSCVDAIIRDYFARGTLPENGVVCEMDS
jgi:pimeloyl-ACP methyl ester carboxylesterase